MKETMIDQDNDGINYDIMPFLAFTMHVGKTNLAHQCNELLTYAIIYHIYA